VSGFATVEFIGNGEPELVPSPYGIAEYMPEPTKCQVSGPNVERIPLPVAATGRLKIIGSIGASTLGQRWEMQLPDVELTVALGHSKVRSEHS
jgi:hypothetical protein